MPSKPAVPVTEREGPRAKGQPGEGTPNGSHAQTRRVTPARGKIVHRLSAITQRVRDQRVAPRPATSSTPEKWEADGLAEALAEALADVPDRTVKVDRRTPAEKAAPQVRGRSLWADGPASPADQWEYLRAGAWAPGEQHPMVEGFAKLYGLVVLALTVAVSVPLWVLQRPGRTALAAVVLGLWWAATLADAPPPVDPAVGGAR